MSANRESLLDDRRCESTSPIAKFDEGPVRCEREAGHDGNHWADEPLEQRIGALVRSRVWDSEGRFVS